MGNFWNRGLPIVLKKRLHTGALLLLKSTIISSMLKCSSEGNIPVTDGKDYPASPNVNITTTAEVSSGNYRFVSVSYSLESTGIGCSYKGTVVVN